MTDIRNLYKIGDLVEVLKDYVEGSRAVKGGIFPVIGYQDHNRIIVDSGGPNGGKWYFKESSIKLYRPVNDMEKYFYPGTVNEI